MRQARPTSIVGTGIIVLGGIFIILVQVSSYMRMVLLGAPLILAVIFDQLRYRMIMSGR